MAMNKGVVAAVCVTLSAGAIAGGLYLRSSSAPLALPASADEAIAGLKSDAYARMDDQRRRQYAFEAGRLLRELSSEERESLREDEDLREAMRSARQDMFDEMVRRAARGEPMPGPAIGDRPRRPDPDEMTDEQREQMEARREQMRERIAQQLKDTWDSGDAQSSGLRQEFFKNRGPGGGGNRGGRGGRGG